MPDALLPTLGYYVVYFSIIKTDSVDERDSCEWRDEVADRFSQFVVCA